MNIEEINRSNKKVAFSTFIFSFLMVVILHAALITMVRNDFEQSGKILTNQIMDSFYLPTIGNIQPGTEMEGSPKYQDFINQTASFLKNYPAAVINIYDQNSQKIYTSNKDEILVYKDNRIMDYIAEFFLIRANDSKVVDSKETGFCQIIWSANFGFHKDKAFIRVIEPMNIDKTRVGTIEIVYDFTRHLWMIDNTRFFCLMLIIGIISSYFIIIDRNFKEMQKLIDQSTQVK